ncbi:MAG TPA: glycosyltransferase family 39 protein [Rhodanobacteraceae bacterium]
MKSLQATGPLAQLTRQPWLRLLVLGLVLGFAFQGSRGLWRTDEGRYTDGALQMLASGNYLIPAYSANRVNLSKPPVTYWIIAGAVKLLGRNTWAVRAPYAAAFVLTILLVYAIGIDLVPGKPWLPALIYACAFVPFASANAVSTDVFLTLFEALAALGFVRLSFGNHQSSRRLDAVLLWLGLGLAFLTKGPPGLILLLAIVPFIIPRGGWRGLGPVFQPLGIAVFFVVGLLWYAIVVVHDPWALHYFLYREIYQRIFTGAQRRHPGPFGWAVAYVPTLVIGSLPWWPLLFRNARHRFAIDGRRQWLPHHPVELFLLLWFGLPLLVFCLAQSRLPLYVLPLFLPLSLLLALALGDDIDLRLVRQRVLFGAWVVALLALKGGIAYFVHTPRDERAMARELTALTRSRAFGALVFVEATRKAYAVEEHTPWGLTLYLDKPVYGIAWGGPESPTQLCRAVRGHRTSLLLLDAATAPSARPVIVHQCGVRAIVPMGTWRGRVLDRVSLKRASHS